MVYESDYDAWYNDVEDSVWSSLRTDMSLYENINFNDLFEDGMSPDDVVTYLFE